MGRITSIVIFFGALLSTGSLAHAGGIPPRETPALPSTIGVGEFKGFTNVGAESVQIDLQCAIASRRAISLARDGPFWMNSYDPANWAGKTLAAYRVHSLTDTSQPNVIMMPDQYASGTVNTIAFFAGIATESKYPIPFPAYNNSTSEEIAFLHADGSVTQGNIHTGYSIDRACVQPTGTTLDDPSDIVGYATAQTNSIEQWRGNFFHSIAARFAITRLELLIASNSGAANLSQTEQSVLETLTSLRSSMSAARADEANLAMSGESSPPSAISDSDLDFTISNLKGLIEKTQARELYSGAYEELASASEDDNPQAALSSASMAGRSFLALGNYSNATELVRFAQTIVNRSSAEIQREIAKQKAIVAAQVLQRQRERARTARLSDVRAAEQKRAAAARLQTEIEKYPPQLGALIRRFGRLPDSITSAEYDGTSVVVWRFGTQLYYIRHGLILGHS